MIRALIFDFDGLILDTELPLFHSWQEIFREHGCDLSVEDWATLLDGSFELGDPFSRLEACVGRPVDRPSLHLRRIGREHELLLVQGPLPGVAETLAKARELQLKLAVASNSERAWVTGHLARLGLLARFDAIVCADDGVRAKPDPALFLAALDALGVQAAEAIAFEDSPAGISAARGAGIYCVAVPNPVTKSLPLSLTDLVLHSLADVPLQRLLDLATEKYARASAGGEYHDGGY
jgi:HAD superfamily hydrolase (TIGR01509 family)